MGCVFFSAAWAALVVVPAQAVFWCPRRGLRCSMSDAGAGSSMAAAYPVTCALVSRLSGNAAGYSIVGQVVQEDVGFVVNDFMIDDGTCRVLARYFHYGKEARTLLGRYIKVVGRLASVVPRYLVCEWVGIVDNADAVSYHRIEAAYNYLCSKTPREVPNYTRQDVIPEDIFQAICAAN